MYHGVDYETYPKPRYKKKKEELLKMTQIIRVVTRITLIVLYLLE